MYAVFNRTFSDEFHGETYNQSLSDGSRFWYFRDRILIPQISSFGAHALSYKINYSVRNALVEVEKSGGFSFVKFRVSKLGLSVSF